MLSSNGIRPFPVLLLIVFLVPVSLVAQPNMPRDYAIEVSATVQTAPPRIDLRWPADARATSYSVFRKRLADGSWQSMGDLAGTATSFTDSNVAASQTYEYGFIKKTTRNLTGYGYIFAGIQAPLIDTRGKLILVIDRSVSGALASELNRLQEDLAGDGWTVLRREVSRDDKPPQVRSLIKSEYDGDRENVKAVFLFGHVPVPYSGNIAPDGHEQHRGAWPADLYYAEMDGTWTDTSVISTNAEKKVNWNIPGDGKFDQNEPPSAVELEIGRVDLSNLTAFSNKAAPRSEFDLLRQYLNKNHNFRHGRINVPRRALICDNFEDKGDDPVANSGWRNFAAFFGAENATEVESGQYLPNATARGYLWSYGAGGGSTYYLSAGVATSDDFATQNVQVVFTMFLGSFYGDWDNESNFLRSALGSGHILTASYSGFPHWHYQHMALGYPIGFSTRFTQNNHRDGPYPPHNQGTHEVHIALMGDPTLRMHPVQPPANLNSATSGDSVNLSWNPSPDHSLVGYHVYRAASPVGPYQRITGSTPIVQTSFTDRAPAGSHIYLVRAIKLETSASGTYFNPSQGIFASATVSGSSVPASDVMIKSGRLVNGIFEIRISGQTGQEFSIEASADLRQWAPIATGTLRGTAMSIQDAQTKQFPQRFYRVRTTR